MGGPSTMGRQPAAGDYSFLRPIPSKQTPNAAPLKQLTNSDYAFMARMDSDMDERRKTAFITELKKDPRFKMSMLEGPKPKFKTVDLVSGPIIKTHKSNKTGKETRKPHQWGPLGGYW